eukprot:CAMPEP_0171131908 /NCGR_PEP_ID=MMETSP0766_2-20121228/123543_1 /TAXON_ID=439317 /ORGANISM="Gambierdiscus australes, Strain CAWD 149" /LENGTH=81 /DNA_ID=CAMNT_0011595223 /DNA_START=88 /DNA_END=330 /DNA_ORIENTATION=-
MPSMATIGTIGSNQLTRGSGMCSSTPTTKWTLEASHPSHHSNEGCAERSCRVGRPSLARGMLLALDVEPVFIDTSPVVSAS